MTKQTVLFIPVSSKKGIGEYMRSTIIATHLKAMYPEINIEFVLNEQASYVQDCKFKTHLVPQSPTRCVEQVNQIITHVQPHLVVFDASGRAKQFQHAHDVGAKVVFISQHVKKRTKGLSLGKVRFTDRHLVAQPEFTMAPLTLWQKAKLKMFNKLEPMYLGCVYLPVNETVGSELLMRYGLNAKEYFLFSAGSGGHWLEGQWASDEFAKLAQVIANKYSKKCVVIYGASYPNTVPESSENVINIHSIENSGYISLLKNAQATVLSGGGSLLQAVSLKVPNVSVAVAKDQPKRIEACAKLGLTLAAKSEIQDLSDKVDQIVDETIQGKLIAKFEEQGLKNGVEIAVNEINQLLSISGQPRT